MKVKQLEDNSTDVNKLEMKLKAYKKTVRILKNKMLDCNVKVTRKSEENLGKAEISLQTEPVESLSEVIQLKNLLETLKNQHVKDLKEINKKKYNKTCKVS